MGSPPSDAGGLKVTDTVSAVPVWVMVAVPITGAPGMVAGTTALNGGDAGPVPTALAAVTVKV